jgi:dihydrofolate reductase
MRKLVAGLFITFDGVVEAPGPSDTPPFEYAGWSMALSNEETGAHIGAQTAASDILLLGRRTYEAFEATFANMGGPMGDGMNNFNKVVVSTTMGTPNWKNTTLISSNVVEEIQKLKAQDGKDITVSGSATLLQTLMKADLVDEYSLMVYPIVLGKGKRLFDGFHSDLNLIEVRPLSTGVVIMRYTPKR